MQLTRYTDYGLRTLIYLGLHSESRVTVRTIATAFNVSREHLLKVVQRLSALGFVRTVRGKGGGLVLASAPADINVGIVVRRLEGTLDVVNCQRPACPILPSCRLQGALNEARNAFLEVLDSYTLATLLDQREEYLRALLRFPAGVHAHTDQEV
nr:Rrf2 family transcriptional regulator [Gammaproteobacteria bacterium]